MANQHSGEDASSSDASISNSDSTLELNIKTLNSRVYNFHVEKNMPVLSFKEKVADQTGVPVGQQRLIFRGKVLKDEHSLSEYHVENGDTLHLVERQPTQEQTSSGPGTGTDTSGNSGSQGNDANTGVPRNRIGQISHSVVLGTFNVGDQGEAAGSDLTRVIGAVLNSLGVGNQATANGNGGAFNAASTNHSGAVPQGGNAEQGPASTVPPSQAQSQFGMPFLSQPFSMPFMGASIPPPSVNLPIPDALNTLSEFMSRMDGVLSQNGYEAPSSETSSADQPIPGLSYDARGLPTAEALSVVLRHAQRLLSGGAASALSHIAGRLEQEAGSMDASVRSQIQSDSVQVGLVMQHLGALFLELGRSILMLRMGNSSAEAVINAGPAVYISQSGPNPIMVQPFPHQTSPLFNAPTASASNSGTSIPVGIVGSAPRNINIHIHAGTSLPPMVSPLVARAAGGDATLGERNGAAAPGDSGAPHVFPVRNVIATAVPSRSATIAVTPVTGTSQPIGVSTSQPTEGPAVISEVTSHIRNLLQNMLFDNQTPLRQQENLVVPNPSVASGGVSSSIDPSRSVQAEVSGEAGESHINLPKPQAQNGQANPPCSSSKSDGESPGELSTGYGSGQLSKPSESNLKDGESSGDSTKPSGITGAPLGLGGGLQPKRRSQQSKIQPKGGEGGTSSTDDQSQAVQSRAVRANGQQILQSLLSQSSHGRASSNAPVGTGRTVQGRGQGLDDVESGAQPSDGQVDVTGMMSQLLDSPALNGLLSGVAQQTGVGSPNVLRNMLQQFTQNPAMRNTVNQLAQQVDREEMRDVFSGVGSGQGGNLDFSSMFQQMMPIVSQVLGGVSVQSDQVQRPSGNDRTLGHGSQSNDIQEVIQQIAGGGSSHDIFRALAQNASDVSGTITDEVQEWLGSNVGLVDQFMETLRSDLSRRLEEDSGFGNEL